MEETQFDGWRSVLIWIHSNLHRWWQVNLEGQHVSRLKTGIHMHEPPEALDHQRSANEQHQRQSYFADNEHAAKLDAAASGSRGSPSFLQSVLQSHSRALQRGRQ